jgi:hypothetical protein
MLKETVARHILSYLENRRYFNSIVKILCFVVSDKETGKMR